MHIKAPDASHKCMPKSGNACALLLGTWHLCSCNAHSEPHFSFLPENIFLQPVSLIAFTTSLRLLQLDMLTKTIYFKETGMILNLYSLVFKG